MAEKHCSACGRVLNNPDDPRSEELSWDTAIEDAEQMIKEAQQRIAGLRDSIRVFKARPAHYTGSYIRGRDAHEGFPETIPGLSLHLPHCLQCMADVGETDCIEAVKKIESSFGVIR